MKSRGRSCIDDSVPERPTDHQIQSSLGKAKWETKSYRHKARWLQNAMNQFQNKETKKIDLRRKYTARPDCPCLVTPELRRARPKSHEIRLGDIVRHCVKSEGEGGMIKSEKGKCINKLYELTVFKKKIRC